MALTIRRATLDDREWIGAFLAQAYGDRSRFKFPARWEWEFVDNPFGVDGELPVWLAEEDGRIVGQTCAMPVPVEVGGRAFRAAWGADLVVLPGHRERGAGRQLIEVEVNSYDIFLSLVMSPITLKVLHSLGFEEMGRVTQVGKRLYLEPQEAVGMIVARLHLPEQGSPEGGPGRFLATALAAVVNRFLALRDRRQRPACDPSVVISPVARFGTEMDLFWEELAPSLPMAIRRHAAYLNWKYVDQPHMDYRRFVARRREKVVGCVILRQGRPPEPNVGVVAELLADPGDELLVHALLAHAVEYLRRLGVKSILAASSLPAYLDACRRFGFVETQEIVAVWHRSGAVMARPSVDPGDWFLSMGDHDWDQYPLL